jgi:hypothetical protein
LGLENVDQLAFEFLFLELVPVIGEGQALGDFVLVINRSRYKRLAMSGVLSGHGFQMRGLLVLVLGLGGAEPGQERSFLFALFWEFGLFVFGCGFRLLVAAEQFPDETHC